MQQTTRHGGGRYYQGGVGAVFQAFAGTVERFGGTVHFQTRVERILVEQGQVAGIVAGGVTHRAPIVLSNAGIQPTVLNLASARTRQWIPRYMSRGWSWPIMRVSVQAEQDTIDLYRCRKRQVTSMKHAR